MQPRGPQPTSGHRRSLRIHTQGPEAIEDLRKALVGPEQQRLTELEEATPTAEMVGALIPKAVRDVVDREPQMFGEILAPAIGTAVKRAVADAFAAVMQRINHLVETGLSWRSLHWRFEAKRTGRSYAEVVLAHTLIYRVEWAVLIDNATSLVLEQATSNAALAQAPDQTSAMLEAINSFVSDALKPASQGAEIQTIGVGDINLWIERGRIFTLAIAVRGAPPVSLREDLHQTLQQIRILHPERQPSTDVGRFSDVHALLVDLLDQQHAKPPAHAQWLLAATFVAALCVIAVLEIQGNVRRRHEAVALAAYERVLGSTPGYVITSVERDGSGYRVRGMRDPRALPAAMVVMSAGLPLATFDLAPFVSADPRFDSPMSHADQAIRAVEQVEFSFPLNRSVPVDAAKAKHAAELIRRAQATANRADAALCVDVIGDSDDTGPEGRNETLRIERASEVARALQRAGVDAAALSGRAGDPMRIRPHARSVTFRALLRPHSQTGGCP
jgi:hypothetical protein